MPQWAATATAAALGIVIASAAFAFTLSPPALLSLIDALFGGGIGVTQPAKGLSFGTHGLTLDVWRPAGTRAADRLPVLIFWYGGGWTSGDRHDYAFAARAFAHAGYVVVVPDYRKVPHVHFPGFVEDGAEAVRWTRDHAAIFGGDPARLALAGHSAGAYTVAMLALDRSWLRAEDVDPRIIRAGIGLSGPYDFYPFDDRRAVAAFAGALDPLLTQPIRFARADAPPLLLVTSDRDTDVRPKNSLHLAARLRAMGAPVELREYRGIGHAETVMALSRPFRGKAPVLADSLAFLAWALRPR